MFFSSGKLFEHLTSHVKIQRRKQRVICVDVDLRDAIQNCDNNKEVGFALELRIRPCIDCHHGEERGRSMWTRVNPPKCAAFSSIAFNTAAAPTAFRSAIMASKEAPSCGSITLNIAAASSVPPASIIAPVKGALTPCQIDVAAV